MKLEIGGHAGKIKPGQVRAYRKNPGDLGLAASAAAHYAGIHGQRMVLIPGNSYMNKVYHVAKESDSVSKFTAMSTKVSAMVVDANGTCTHAVAA